MNFSQVRGQLQKNGVIKFILQSGLLSNTNFIKIINRWRCSSILYSYFAHNITFNCFMSIEHQNYGSRTAYLQNMEAFSYHQVCLFRGSIWVFLSFDCSYFAQTCLFGNNFWVSCESVQEPSVWQISTLNFHQRRLNIK